METEKRNIIMTFGIIILIIVFTIAVLLLMNDLHLIEKEYYKASNLKIKTIYSEIDYDNDKMDDYTEFVLGARAEAKNNPKYISKYYENSYPPDDEGICTDTIWRAFKEAGYSLRDMIDNDITLYPEDYPNIKEKDINIDFRRVANLQIFFSKYAQTLTTDPTNVSEWQPGDIVIFEDNQIGIISDRRNSEGITFVIHNIGQKEREEDYLTKSKVKAHYRFDAAKVDESILKPWIEE